MGVVYLTEQREPVEREVALKMLKREMDTEQVVGRFEAERQALAVMEHRSIAQVFDAGVSEDGLPYFVMEAVRGTPDGDTYEYTISLDNGAESDPQIVNVKN